MSQIYVPTTSSTPAIPTSFSTQDGSAVPVANVLLIDAFDTTEDNDNGIETKGGVAAGDPPGPGATNEVSIYLTNRTTGTTTTENATPKTIISIPLGGDPATYYIYGNVQAFNSTTPAGASYTFNAAYRTSGGVCVEIAGEFGNVFEDAVLVDCDARLDPNGDSADLTVQGVVGLSINWNALLEYRKVT